jgi:hypothetical protein
MFLEDHSETIMFLEDRSSRIRNNIKHRTGLDVTQPIQIRSRVWQGVAGVEDSVFNQKSIMFWAFWHDDYVVHTAKQRRMSLFIRTSLVVVFIPIGVCLYLGFGG